MRGGPELISSWIWSGSSTAGCSHCLAASSLHQMGWTGLPKTCTVSRRMYMHFSYSVLHPTPCSSHIGAHAPSPCSCSIPRPPHHTTVLVYVGTCSPLAHPCTVGWAWYKTLAEWALLHSPWHSFLHGDTYTPITSASRLMLPKHTWISAEHPHSSAFPWQSQGCHDARDQAVPLPGLAQAIKRGCISSF